MHKIFYTSIIILITMGCNTNRFPDISLGIASTSKAYVKISYTKTKNAHPPFQEIHYNITLSNTSDRSLWFLIPARRRTTFPESISPRSYKSELHGEEQQILIHTFTDEEIIFHGIEIPPRRTVLLMDMYYKIIPEGDLNKQLPMEVLVSPQLSLGGKTLQEIAGKSLPSLGAQDQYIFNEATSKPFFSHRIEKAILELSGAERLQLNISDIKPPKID